jgi:phosphoribosylanthranilate isomerase
VTWIKICGTTSQGDAELAIRAGASAIGMLMSSSPRQVTDATAYSIGTITPAGVETIGVFVNEAVQTLVNTSRFCKFTGVQLHGDEDAAYIQAVRNALPRVKIVKAISAQDLSSAPQCKPDAWLIDTRDGAQRGGTGKPFDWKVAKPSLAKLREPLIVAGGLNHENVQQALELLRPWGVDVVSGVEAYPGKKHPGRLAQFIDAVRQFDARNLTSAQQVQKGIAT